MLKIKTLFNNGMTFLLKWWTPYQYKDKAKTLDDCSILFIDLFSHAFISQILIGLLLMCQEDVKLETSKIYLTQKFCRT